MPTLDLDGVSIFYEDTRHREPAIVFSHGLLMSSAMYSAQIRVLRARYRCVAYDHRGQGRSGIPPERVIDMDTLTADAVALLDHLELDAVHFVGLSTGGFVGMRLAARHPERVRSLVLIATAPDPEPARAARRIGAMAEVGRFVGMRPFVGRAMRTLFGRTFLEDPARASEVEEWRRRLRGIPRRAYRAVRGVMQREGVIDELPNIKAPTLIIHGDEDRAILRKRALLCHQGIAGSRFLAIPRAGHSTTIEAPEVVTGAIASFLEEVG